MPRECALQGDGTLAMTGASQALVGANPNRQEIIISSNSAANSVWLALAESPATPGAPIANPTAVANRGVRILTGQTFRLTGYTGAIAIIGTAADVVGWVEL